MIKKLINIVNDNEGQSVNVLDCRLMQTSQFYFQTWFSNIFFNYFVKNKNLKHWTTASKLLIMSILNHSRFIIFFTYVDTS